jgi:hypothetical protein
MSKAIKYGTNLAIIGGIGNGAINLIQQVNRMGDDPALEFDWKSLFTAIAQGGIIGGAAGLIAGGIVDCQNSLEEPKNTNAMLYKLITEKRLTKEDTLYIKLNEKADQLITLINGAFSAKLACELIKGGSSEKKTALRSNFDIDIYASFKPKSFTSTRRMRDEVYFLLEKHSELYGVIRLRQQTKSVGVFFLIDGEELKVDIVPCLITNSIGNKTYGYLNVRNEDFWSDNSTFTKTDIHVLNNIKLTETQQKILVTLKIWKNKNELPISSYLLQCFVLEAYSCRPIPRTFAKKIIMILEFIMNGLQGAVIRSAENTNNILTNISDEDKSVIICACKEVIEDYEYQPNSIVELIS